MMQAEEKDFGRVFNFSAGPSCLPIEVLQEAQEQLLNCNGSGMSVMEMSHRGKAYSHIHEECIMGLKELLNIPANFKILLLAGGATLQFASVPLNLIQDPMNSASYVLTGIWSEKAYKEGLKYGKMEICADNKNSNYTKISPLEEWKINEHNKYVHYCSNETVHGIEFHTTPSIEACIKEYTNQSLKGRMMQQPLLIADVSSNFCSGEVDFSKHSLIYAGAQKNIGPAGVTVVVLREDIAGKELSICPTLCSYQTQIKNSSLYNTPPCFPIYMVNLMVKYIKQKGGIQYMSEMKKQKSEMIYSLIDSSDDFYCAPVEKSSRSFMNIRFNIPGKTITKTHDGISFDENLQDLELQRSLEKKFVEEARKHKLYELGGHRCVGGCRASLYAGMTMAGVNALVDFMKAFQQDNAM